MNNLEQSSAAAESATPSVPVTLFPGEGGTITNPPASGSEPLAGHASPPPPASREAHSHRPSETLTTQGARVVLPAASIQSETLPYVTSPPNYEILCELGRGGMGVVYKARQTTLGRTVALKMILHARHAGAEDLARFRTEAQAVARLEHPHIVHIHEFGEHEGLAFFSLEFIDGGSLADRLQQGPLAAFQSAVFVEKLARAIHHAHLHHIVHRDLKPANVLLTAAGEPRIADFGLAKNLEANDGLSRSGAVMGTPAYMAPEQAEGRSQDVGPATDVYALGAILYECLTGQVPFRGTSLHETMQLVLTREPTPPRRLVKNLSRDLEAVCLKCLEKNPKKRYPTAEALAEDLARYLRGDAVVAGRRTLFSISVRKVRRHWKFPVFVGVIYVLGASVTLLTPSLMQKFGPAGDLEQPLKRDPGERIRRSDAATAIWHEEIQRKVNILRRQPQHRIREHPATFQIVDEIAPPNNAAFEVLEDERIIDLRGWQQVPAGKEDTLLSAVSMSSKISMHKVRSANEYVQQFRTSGAGVFARCESHPDDFHGYVQKKPVFVGKEEMKSCQCVVDVSRIPIQQDFDLRIVATYWNSLQQEKEQWFGSIGYKNSFKTSMLFLFPDHRPFTSYRLTVAPTVKGEESDFVGTPIVIMDEQRTYLYWEIPQPQEGFVYRVHWKW
jgi:serine/threonine protein kinase